MAALESGIADRYDLSSLKRILYGSSPMSPQGIARAVDTFPGVEFTQGYGLTETAPLLTLLEFEPQIDALAGKHEERLRSCGRPLSCVELRIIDDAGVELPANEMGDIVARGPNVFAGYLNQQALSESVFRDGFFHTGDAGMMNEEGYLYVLDRKKDIIISGGENVYSAEVETVLLSHPAVAEAAVIAVPDERLVEKVFAVIVPVPGSDLDQDAVIEHCRGRIGGFKIPRGVAFVEQLPRSALGKILKAELRKTYGSD